ncbi:hypothetical protein GGR54DRAFT_643972 [Hypoxylon sp. NC1633]|nr:hypothetical protein GGR54DRAFT_643972 [Hypoxylon sp. NC1633]
MQDAPEAIQPAHLPRPSPTLVASTPTIMTSPFPVDPEMALTRLLNVVTKIQQANETQQLHFLHQLYCAIGHPLPLSALRDELPWMLKRYALFRLLSTEEQLQYIRAFLGFSQAILRLQQQEQTQAQTQTHAPTKPETETRQPAADNRQTGPGARDEHGLTYRVNLLPCLSPFVRSIRTTGMYVPQRDGPWFAWWGLARLAQAHPALPPPAGVTLPQHYQPWAQPQSQTQAQTQTRAQAQEHPTPQLQTQTQAQSQQHRVMAAVVHPEVLAERQLLNHIIQYEVAQRKHREADDGRSGPIELPSVRDVLGFGLKG